MRWSWTLAVVSSCLLPLSAKGQELHFEDVTKEAGLYEPLLGIMGHGAAAGDYDGDGDVDLYVGGFNDRPDAEYEPAKGPVANRLLRNVGEGKFEWDHQPAVELQARTSGAVFADLDNDGDLDLYVANNSKGRSRKTQEPQRTAQLTGSQLFRNDDGKFVDVTQESHAAPESILTARNVGVFDFDRDSLLDLFVVEDVFTREPSSMLLHNHGGLRFVEVTADLGLPEDLHGLGLSVADVNRDGLPDVFVGHSNKLFLSTPRGFVEHPQNETLFAWEQLDNEDWPCGAHFGDLDNDGDFDLVLGIHHEQARNRIFLNNGTRDGVPVFQDVTQAAGLPDRLTTKSPHVELQDFDNDGRLDLYFSSAWMDAKGDITPLVYRNLGTGEDGIPRFEGPKPAAGSTMVYYPAGPSADYDGDGRIDLFLVNWFRGNYCRLMRNTSDAGNWLNVRVQGTQSLNRMGIGARVYAYAVTAKGEKGEFLGVREVTTGYGYASGQPAVCHFGLGGRDYVYVRAELPDGQVVERKRVPANSEIVLKEPQEK